MQTDEGKKAFNAKAMALRETRRTSVALAYLRGKASLIYDSVKDMKAEGKDVGDFFAVIETGSAG